MIKQIVLSIFLLCSVASLGQLRSILVVKDSISPFNIPMPPYSIIINAQDDKQWLIKQSALSTSKLSTISNKKLINSYAAEPELIDIDLDRAIKRGYEIGMTIPGNNIEDFVNYIYYAPPTITCTITGVYPVEIGTSQTIIISGNTVNNGDNLDVVNVRENLEGLGIIYTSADGATSYTTSITFNPKEAPSGNYTERSYRFYATQSYVGVESGTATSGSTTATSAYPILYGISTTNYSSSLTGIYTDADITHLIQAEGNKTVNFNGVGYIYFIFPVDWGDENLSIIYDHNGFNAINAFNRITGLSLIVPAGEGQDGYTEEYVLYISYEQVTAVNWNNWQFIR